MVRLPRIRLDARLRQRLASLATGVLLVALAVLVAWLSNRYPVEMDWTSAGRHTLSEASREVLDQVDGKLEVTAYARRQPQLRELIERFVERYRRIKPDIEFSFVNPDAVPDEMRRLGISVNGELVLRYKGRIEHVRRDSEEEFTNALRRLLRGSERWLAFLEGHGERSAVDDADHDLSQWAQQLKGRGVNFQPLNLGSTRAIPDNTSALVIAGPQVDVLPGEVALITDYLDAGGNLLWLADPGALHGLEPLAQYLGVSFPAGTLLDATTQLVGIRDATVALVTAQQYRDHGALDQFTLTTFFPGAAALDNTGDTGWSAVPLFTSSELSWLETGELGGEAEFDEGADRRGPLALAQALEREGEETDGGNSVRTNQRVVVVGDGDFISNAYLGNAGNLELGMRLVNWLTRDEDFIAIPARTADDTQLEMPNVALGAFGVFFLFVFPLALLATGLYTWWRRGRA